MLESKCNLYEYFPVLKTKFDFFWFFYSCINVAIYVKDEYVKVLVRE